MKLFKELLLIPAIFYFTGNVYAGSASAKLSTLANSLIKDYTAKTGTSKTILAIFPLNCEEKLEKQRVGFAASEVISHRFVANSAFTVVERSELGKLLSEQKLQASGAVDNETAVKLGKVLGAGVILVGNIQKVGRKYQVNARLVNAETSEVLSSGYEEISLSAFEDDASVYLNLVPEAQTLGIYLAYNYRSNPNRLNSYMEYGQSSKPKPFSSGFIGGGILYKPTKNLLIDVGASTLVTDATFAETSIFNTGTAKGTGTYYIGVNYIESFAIQFAYRVGIGFQQITKFPFNGESVEKSIKSTGFLKGGIEYKPQSRIGVGLNIKYDLRKMGAISKQGNKMFELNQVSYEPTISLYF